MADNQPNLRRPRPILRKTGALLMASLTTLTLAACGGGGGGSGNFISDGTTAGSVVNPLPTGTGVATFSFGPTRGEFVKVNATSGVVSTLSYPCLTDNQGFVSADTRPDGVVLGLSTDIYRVDLMTGACVKQATAPAAVSTIAVGADGKIYLTSTGVDGNGKYTLYVLDSTGATVLSSIPINGGDLGFIKGIDFAPDGKLYMSAFDNTLGYQVYQTDPATGAATPKFATSNLAGDIDIDTAGKLRSAGVTPAIYTINLTTGAVETTLATDRQTQKLLVYR